jgi:hypothetical protein
VGRTDALGVGLCHEVGGKVRRQAVEVDALPPPRSCD